MGGDAHETVDYAKDYASETPIIVLLSLRNLSLDGNVLNIPLFLVDHLTRLIQLGLKERNRSND